jgi:hypothetical protein
MSEITICRWCAARRSMNLYSALLRDPLLLIANSALLDELATVLAMAGPSFPAAVRETVRDSSGRLAHRPFAAALCPNDFKYA